MVPVGIGGAATQHSCTFSSSSRSKSRNGRVGIVVEKVALAITATGVVASKVKAIQKTCYVFHAAHSNKLHLQVMVPSDTRHVITKKNKWGL